MGRKIRCPECGELYNSAERLEDLRDAEGMCLGCDAEIEVEDWDDVLASYEEEEDEAEAAVAADEDEEFDEFGKWSADDDAGEEAEAESDDFSADSSYGTTTEFEEGDEDEDDEVETDE